MKIWREAQKDVSRTTPEKETAKSLLRMMETRLKAAESLDKIKFTSIVVEGYYEVIKEGITALMALDGRKTLSHEALVAYLKEFYTEFPEYEIHLIDQLRKIRNKIVYKGFFVQTDYLDRNNRHIREIIAKLRHIINRKLDQKI